VKILYSRRDPGTGFKLTTDETEVEVRPGTREFTAQLWDDEGKMAGNLFAEHDQNKNEMQIKTVGLRFDVPKGQRIGTRLYNAALARAEQLGAKLMSDSRVSQHAERVWMALERRGLRVWKNPDVEVRTHEEPNPDTWMIEKTYTIVSKDPKIPVFRLEGPTNIRLSFEELAVAPEDMDMTPAELEAAMQGWEAVELAQAQTIVDKMLESLPGLNPDKVKVLARPEEAPTEVYDALKQGRMLGARGSYEVESDTVYLFTDNLDSYASLVETFLHEAIAHKGLRAMMPGDKLNALLDSIYESAGTLSEFSRIADKYQLDPADPESRRIVAEEYIAYLAEKDPKATILQRVVAAVRAVLRRMGLLETWSDNDILALLRETRAYLRGTPYQQIEVERATYETDTGEEVTVMISAEVQLRRLKKRMAMAKKLARCVG
jgi:hypothetical protein